jgi:hypothetical protein
MTVSAPGFIAMLTLPHEDPLEHAQLWNDWTTAYPNRSPIEQGYIEQAVTALIEKRRIERIRATVRTQKVRTAVLDWERAQEDTVAQWLDKFNDHCPSALVGLLRSAAGCRWAISDWSELARQLPADGTWFGEFRIGAIQLQGQSACINEVYFSEAAFTTWIDCLACQPNPKQRDIDAILERRNIPKHLQDRDIPQWPRDPAECRARLQALVDRELPRLRALEETLRVQYEEPSRAEARDMALASVSREETSLLRAERLHEHCIFRPRPRSRRSASSLRRRGRPPRGSSTRRCSSSVRAAWSVERGEEPRDPGLQFRRRLPRVLTPAS